MKQGKLIRRAVSAALAGCMMFTLSAPALAESTDALMQLSISGNRAASVLDAENVAEEIKINNNVIDPADYENIVVTPGNYTFHYDPVQKILTSTNTTKTINTITIEVPDDVDVVLDGKENIAVHNLTINRAHDVTISSDNYSAIGRRAVITCTGKVTINAPEGTYAIGYTSNADGTLIIHRANEVEIDASGSSRVLSGYGKADITCDGPVTIHGEKDGGSVLANAGNFTYHRTDGADYVYFTSEDGEEGAIDAGVTPIEANARYSYLRIEEKQDAHLKVNNGTATAGDTTSGELDSFKGQKVTVVSKVQETDDRKFDGWELTNAPAGFTISAEKLAQKEFSFIMPTGNVELTAHHSNKLEVSGGTAKVNGNSNADFARPGAAVTVTGHDSNASFSKLVGWKLKKGSLTAIIDADGNSLNVTVDAENNYLLDASGAKIKNETFTFTMSDKPVELSAVYSIPAIAMSLPVIVEGGTINGTQDSFVRVKAGEKVTIKADAPAENMQFHHWKVEEGTSADFGVTVGTLGSDTEQGTEEIAFIMPRGAVRLTAQWSATPATRPDPDQPLDEDFGVDTPQPKPEPEEPEAPAESAAGAIAAVAIGGAAVWGGYEITTRAILKNLLPADAAIPKTQGQLAELLWQNAGCPQPTVAQATDAAAAARWCVEQGYLEEDFAPEKYVPKYKVIRILKQAKSDT